MNHRPSSIKLFDQCSFSALNTYYGGGVMLETPYPGYATGSAFHAMMKGFIQSEVGGTNIEPDLTEFPLESVREAQTMFEWFTEYFEFDPDAVIACEDPISAGDVTGIPDLTMELNPKTYMILDWKSAWSEQGHEFDSLGYYAAIWSQLEPGIKEFVLRVCMVRRRFYLDDVILSRDDALDTWDILLRKMDVIERLDPEDKSQWPATAGHHCDYCRVRHACPLTHEDRLIAGAIESEADAEAIANHTVALEAKLKMVKSNLKAWCRENGPIRLSGGSVYGPRETTRIEYPDAGAVIRTLHQEDRVKVVKIDSKALGKLVNDDPVLATKISKFRADKSSTRYGIYKEAT